MDNRRRWSGVVGFASVALCAFGGACVLSKAGLGALNDGPGPATVPEAGSAEGASVGVDAEGGPPSDSLDASGGLSSSDGGYEGGAPPEGGSDGSTSPADSGSVCDFSGAWGSRVTIDVTWAPQGINSVILAPGTGRITQWIKSIWVQNGSHVTETAALCGIKLPDFTGTQATGSERYGIHFPDSLFDRGYLVAFTTTGTLGGVLPGSQYTTDPTAVLLGLTLTDPANASWPSTITTAVDSDQDGKPGVTAEVVEASGYSDFPVDFGKAQRADRVYLAIRQVAQVTAKADDCDHFSGSVLIPEIPPNALGKFAIDSHVIGCRLAGDAGDCNAFQSGFVDGTQPVFSPSSGTEYVGVRLVPGATCATVRQQLP